MVQIRGPGKGNLLLYGGGWCPAPTVPSVPATQETALCAQPTPKPIFCYFLEDLLIILQWLNSLYRRLRSQVGRRLLRLFGAEISSPVSACLVTNSVRPFGFKIDGCVPHTLHVDLRILGQLE